MPSVVAIALGEMPPAEVETLVAHHFDGAAVERLDRRRLRRRPFQELLRLWRNTHTAAILVAPDLEQPRLQLTSLVLALPRCASRWRIDQHGRRERWTLREHVARHALSMARHFVACAVALVLAEPLLRSLEPAVKPRELSHAKKPKRLLYLRSQLWLGLEGGGSVAHTAGVIGGLEQAGVEVRVVSSDWLPGVTAPTRVIRPVVWFDGWQRELEDLSFNFAFLVAAWREVRRYRPDVLYQRHTTFNCAGAVLSRVLGVPLVLEFNSSELWKGRYWGGLRLRRAAALVERINLRAADRVIVVSEVLREQLRAVGLPDQKIVVNPNAVDPTQFDPVDGGQALRDRLGLGSAIVVGFSGTFGAWHGIPTLAQALPRVLDARPHARWLLIGDGPLVSLIDDVIGNDQLHDRAVRVGMVPHADIPHYLGACDILVSPHGRQADGGEFFGSPTKLYEYMAAGRPIVASAVGQIRDVLDDEHSALLIPPDDPVALSDAIVRLIDDACLRQRLGGAARRDAERCHTWRQNAERVVQAFIGESRAWSL